MKLLLGSFGLSALLMILGLNQVYSHFIPVALRTHEADPELQRAIPERYRDASVSHWKGARRNREFWMRSGLRGSRGAALRVLENPDLLDSIYPGYAETRNDPELWDRMFALPWDGGVWSPLVNGVEAPGGVITSPWTGCFEVFRKYGGDILVLGSSETYYGVIPKPLQAAFSGEKRVLQCGGAGMDVPALQSSLSILGHSGKRARLVLIGYSLWFPRPEATRGETLPGNAALEKYQTSHSMFSRKLSDWISVPGWDELFPPTLAGLSEARHRLRIQESRAREIAAVEEKVGPLFQDSGEEGFLFPEKFARDAKAIGRLSEQATPSFGYLKRLSAADCGLDAAAAELDRLIAEALRFSDQVAVYIPPTTPLLRAAGPPCLRDAVARMISSRRSARVLARTDEWRAYGLDYRDFTHAESPGLLRLDVNHVNFAGALKVTRKLAAWLAEAAGK